MIYRINKIKKNDLLSNNKINKNKSHHEKNMYDQNLISEKQLFGFNNFKTKSIDDIHKAEIIALKYK